MRFFTQLTASAFAAATLASANTLTFISKDSTNRVMYFTGSSNVDPVEVPGNSQKKVDMPEGWIGNAYAVAEGAENKPGMLAEVTYQGWNGLTYFDVSAIVDPNDVNGVKQLYPASYTEPLANVKELLSGCTVFPCNKAYYHPDDVQTVTTEETDLICTLGGGASANVTSRAEPRARVARHYVLGMLS
ncbi:hypothetical protein GGR56DRAFT_106279 [Xylariaceae sp. FL0804]|nr:hypothetical protein GGR56DRAFT_106279 [Xylariaceae sp. FL0804]